MCLLPATPRPPSVRARVIARVAAIARAVGAGVSVGVRAGRDSQALRSPALFPIAGYFSMVTLGVRVGEATARSRGRNAGYNAETTASEAVTERERGGRDTTKAKDRVLSCPARARAAVRDAVRRRIENTVAVLCRIL